MVGRGVNLNSIQFDEKLLSDKVLEQVSDLEIFRHYIGDGFSNSSSINSPLRKDKVPSFSVFYGSRAGRHMFKDWGSNLKGDCFRLVQLLYGLPTYAQAVEKVAVDMGLFTGVSNQVIRKPVERLIRNDRVHIGIKSRMPKPHDYGFWEQFGITPEVLERYNVKAVSHIFINDRIINAPKYCYSYLEYKDGVPTYKIYQPYDKEHKFINNNDFSVWEGWTQLPETGNLLIITSGRKDVMSIVSTTDFPAVALQSESVLPKEHIVSQLRKRFNEIIVFYDNDQQAHENWGRKYGKTLADAFGFRQIEIPDFYLSKDYSDLVKDYGQEFAVTVLSKLVSHEQLENYSDSPF